MTIPASKIVNVIPGVIGTAGAALALTGLILSADKASPIGTVSQFSTAAAVSAFYGPTSPEANLAAIYFAGYTNNTASPGNLLFAQYPTAVVGAYLRTASLAGMTLTQLQALSGTVIVTVDGTVKTSSAINLSAATSFSNAATIIAAAFTGGPTVTYDAQRQAFVFGSTTTGATSTIGFASGTLSPGIFATQATGAVTSQGSAIATPAAFMTAVVAAASNWACFMTVFEPVIADKLAFATWTSQQNNRFVYACWDTDITAVQSGNTTSFGAQVNSLSLAGSVPFTADPARALALGTTAAALAQPLAAFEMGYAASLDFGRTNGRTAFAFRSQPGLVTGVTDATVADILDANGYNFYGDYATSSAAFRFMQPGSVGGTFAWLDSYLGQINLNAALQQALLAFLASAGSVAYNNEGYSALETVCLDPINAALNFGTIRTNVALGSAQIVAVNSGAGQKIDTVLSSRGWYLQIKDPGAQVRGQRGSPLMTFWYMDGGSIQKLNLASLLVQ